MKLSARSCYGTRLMVDLAHNYNEGFVQMGDIAKRHSISVKYLEQLIVSLKKAKLVESVRGPRGGHKLAKAPSDITMGEIVDVLEHGINLSRCVDNPGTCKKADLCQTRDVWHIATRAFYDKLNSIKLSEMIE